MSSQNIQNKTSKYIYISKLPLCLYLTYLQNVQYMKNDIMYFPINLPTYPRPGSGRPFSTPVKRNISKSMSYTLSECTTFFHQHNL